MFIFGMTIRRASKFSMFALLFLLSSITYGDSSRELVQDESRVILAVENMT